jgi:hypothetical protein
MNKKDIFALIKRTFNEHPDFLLFFLTYYFLSQILFGTPAREFRQILRFALNDRNYTSPFLLFLPCFL